ncbi:hypothetical protein ACGVWS_14725 [Enterobacteriaceae bacterium LUAb1]
MADTLTLDFGNASDSAHVLQGSSALVVVTYTGDATHAIGSVTDISATKKSGNVVATKNTAWGNNGLKSNGTTSVSVQYKLTFTPGAKTDIEVEFAPVGVTSTAKVSFKAAPLVLTDIDEDSFEPLVNSTGFIEDLIPTPDAGKPDGTKTPVIIEFFPKNSDGTPLKNTQIVMGLTNGNYARIFNAPDGASITNELLPDFNSSPTNNSRSFYIPVDNTGRGTIKVFPRAVGDGYAVSLDSSVDLAGAQLIPGETTLVFITKKLTPVLLAPGIQGLHGNKLTPSSHDSSFMVTIPDPGNGSIKKNSQIVVMNRSPSSDGSKDSLVASAILADTGDLGGPLVEVPYQGLVTGINHLYYYVAAESGNVTISEQLFYSLTQTTPNQPSDTASRIYTAPVIKDHKGEILTASLSSVINFNVYSQGDLTCEIAVTNGTESKDIRLGDHIYVKTYVNAHSGTGSVVAKIYPNDQKPEPYIVKAADVTAKKASIPLPVSYFSDCTSDYNGTPGTVYVEYSVGDDGKSLSNVWHGHVDTVPPGYTKTP